MSEMKAVLWDFDGTVVDTERVWIDVEIAFLASYGVQFTTEQAHALIGVDSRITGQVIGDLIPGRPFTPEQTTAEILRRVEDRVAASPLPFKPGAPELLAAVRAEGLACALVSASPRSMLESAVARMPADTFAVIVSSDDVERHKPDPEPYLRAMGALGVRPDEALVIEDSVVGTASGNAAGAVVMAVPDQLPVPAAPRRVIVDTLAGMSVDDLRNIWRKHR